MDTRVPLRLALWAILLFGVNATAPRAHGQDVQLSAAPLPLMPSDKDRGKDPGLSLRGPAAETISGGAFILTAPAWAMLTFLTTGPGLFDCVLAEDSSCDDSHRRERERGIRNAIGVGVALGALGAFLLAHGAHRIRRVREARRRELKPSAFSLDAAPQRASLSLKWTF